MNRQEALAVLHEINRECKEAIIATCVSLEAPSSQLLREGRGYQIKMKCELDAYSIQCLNPIIQRNNLTLKEDKGLVIIYKPK